MTPDHELIQSIRQHIASGHQSRGADTAVYLKMVEQRLANPFVPTEDRALFESLKDKLLALREPKLPSPRG